jgi:hypothetical protein
MVSVPVRFMFHLAAKHVSSDDKTNSSPRYVQAVLLSTRSGHDHALIAYIIVFCEYIVLTPHRVADAVSLVAVPDRSVFRHIKSCARGIGPQ